MTTIPADSAVPAHPAVATVATRTGANLLSLAADRLPSVLGDGPISDALERIASGPKAASRPI